MIAAMLQILQTDGKIKKEDQAPILSKEQLKKIYETMVFTRVFDDKCVKLQRAGRIGFFVPSFGQEASVVGSAMALAKEDWFFPSYRDHAIALLRGASLKSLLCQLWGNSEDIVKGRQMPNHFSFKEMNYVSISSPIGTQMTQAVGVAWGAQLQKHNIVVITYFGDGATSSNDFHAAMNLAGVLQAPMIFFCENNQWAISVPRSKQTASASLAIKSQAYGFDGICVDGNDALAVYSATKEAVDKARAGKGPTLIEAVTYRMGPHSTSDDPTRYRKSEEVSEWEKKDPIERFKKYLLSKGIFDPKSEAQVWEEAKAKLDAAISEVEKIAPPPMESIFEDVYAQMPWHLKEQMEELREELKG